MRKIFIILILAAITSGCEMTSVDMDCLYNITPYVQQVDKGDETLPSEVIAYSFYADTTQWRVASYDDALVGKLTSRQGTEQKDYDFKAEQDASGVLICGAFTSQPVMIVVCDPADKIYAWRQVALADNLPEIYVDVHFRPWKAEAQYIEEKWTMVNEFIPSSTPEP